MKYQKIICVGTFTILAFFASVSWYSVSEAQTDAKVRYELLFEATSKKKSVLLGEPVFVEFELRNVGTTTVAVHQLGVENGILKVYVADADGDFKRFWGYGWGNTMSRMRTLAPGEAQKYKEITILNHGKIETDGLSVSAARAKTEDSVNTEFAFPQPGKYFIKAKSSFADKLPNVGSGALPVQIVEIETEPIEVVVKEPVGDDRSVWNRIKGNPQIVFLLQSGELPAGKSDKVISEVEEIVRTFPNSMYATHLRRRLDDYRDVESKAKRTGR